MPNWVKNNVSVTGDKVAVDLFAQRHFTLIDKEIESTIEFDFNTIKSMSDKVFKGDLGQEELEKYGSDNWYNWSINNWGTKWNACDTYIEGMTEFSDSTAELRFSFNTAWSCPEPIYSEISKLYPNLSFDVEFADEDIGNNCGTIMISDGDVSIDYMNDTEFANDVWGYEAEEEDV